MAAMFSTVCPTPHFQTNELNYPAAKPSITSAVTAVKRLKQISAVLNTEKYDSKKVNGHHTITKVDNSNLVEKKAAPLTPMFPPPLMKVAAESLQYESGLLGAVPAVTAAVDGGVHNAMSYLTRILSSKVYDVAIESPLDRAPKLSERLGVNVWLKREDLQPVFSFKLRGAYNMMAKLTSDQLAKGVICSSAGNHAQGVALSAKKLGCHYNKTWLWRHTLFASKKHSFASIEF